MGTATRLMGAVLLAVVGMWVALTSAPLSGGTLAGGGLVVVGGAVAWWALFGRAPAVAGVLDAGMLAAVLELHGPVDVRPAGRRVGPRLVCGECSRGSGLVVWPCAVTRRVAGLVGWHRVVLDTDEGVVRARLLPGVLEVGR